MLETSYLSVSQRERSNAFVLQNRNAHKNYSLEINLIFVFRKKNLLSFFNTFLASIIYMWERKRKLILIILLYKNMSAKLKDNLFYFKLCIKNIKGNPLVNEKL